MQETKKFFAGDRVHIDPAYWDQDVAGRTGKVAAYPDGATPQEGTVWVELDVIEWKPDVVEGAEVDVDALRRL